MTQLKSGKTVTKALLAQTLSLMQLSVYTGEQTPGYWERGYMRQPKAELAALLSRCVVRWTDPEYDGRWTPPADVMEAALDIWEALAA